MPPTHTREHAPPVASLWIADVQVASLLGVHRSTLWRWLDRGLIPRPRRVGGRTLWLRDDVELFARCSSLDEFHRLRRKSVSAGP